MKRWAWAWMAALLVLVVGTGIADGLDARGWVEGEPATNAGRVLMGMQERRAIELPDIVGKRIKRRPALLVYFSPTCPHCRHVQPELTALAATLHRKVDIIGVATGSTTEEQLAEFVETFDVPYRVVIDADRLVGAAMGARSTPSALLVARDSEGLYIMDGWYPFAPGYGFFVEMRVADDPWDAFHPGEYQGSGVCAGCHDTEAGSWQLTHHSVAWNTLVSRNEHENPECTDCHVTGAGQPGGWTAEGESDLVDVGCEACHGPGGPHDGERLDARTTCEGCHDADHSIAFSLDKGLPLIDHYKVTTMDEAAFWERRQALYEGRAPQELLAFGEGAFVGSGQCQECHAEQHAWWSEDPGHAMDRLHEAAAADPGEDHYREGADTDVTCVQCHASPLQSGPPPQELAGYRLDESVGCESCHGPGEAHVAAGGGTDNIQGLGASCPVCVLEAICTSCHTAQWDPGWDLDTRLEGVHH